MSEDNESLLNIVNSSGFLFQMRIEHEISSQASTIGDWKVIAHEHRWDDIKEDTEKFIDIILESGNVRLVMECKRVIDANWIFPILQDRRNITRAKLLWSTRTTQNRNIICWNDFFVLPISPEAMYCTMRGQSDKDTPMLEKYASLVTRATEALSIQEVESNSREFDRAIVYIPVIVTNAKIFICVVDPSIIGLENGRLETAEILEIPFIRFRKNLSKLIQPRKIEGDLRKENIENDRTVFVINSTKLTEYLRKNNIPYNQHNSPWPWEGLL